MEPAALPGDFGGRLVLEIAGEAAAARRLRRVAHQHLAGLARSDVAIGIIDDANLDARHRPSERAGADLARFDGVAKHTHHLRHAPELDHGKAEALLERRVQLGLDAGADAKADLVLPFVLPGRELQQHGAITPR
jgi:hypothetical protein